MWPYLGENEPLSAQNETTVMSEMKKIILVDINNAYLNSK